MTGPEHYRTAERLLEEATDLAKQGHGILADRAIASAAVHAQLATTAAAVHSTQAEFRLAHWTSGDCPAWLTDWQAVLR